MALEREDAHFHASHWGVENTSAKSHRIRETDLEPDSPSKDSIMSDETTSASAVDVQMILEHDDLDLRGSLLQPSVVVPIATIQRDEPNNGELPEARLDHTSPHQMTKSPAGQQPISPGGEATSMLAPTAAFTPRRSPRASASASNSRAGSVTPDSKALNSVKAATMARASPKPSNTPQPGQAGTFPIPEHIQSSAFRDGFISSALPSPSLFQVTDGGFSHNPMMFNTSTREAAHSEPDAETTAPAATETLQGAIPSIEYDEEGAHPLEMDVNMETGDEDQPTLDPPTTDVSLSSSPISRPLFTPLSHSKVPEGPQFPSSSTADLSALFASPVPLMSQPVLSPFRLHQNFQSFSMPHLSAEQSSTPPPMTPPSSNAQDDTPMRPVFPMQSSPSNRDVGPALSPLRSLLPVTPEKSSTPHTEAISLETEQKHEDSVMKVETTTTNPTTGSSNLSIGLSTPTRPLQGIVKPGSTTRPMLSLQGSLTPLLGPMSTARLPFPITPKRASQADFFTPVRGRGDLFAPVGNNPQNTDPLFPHASSNENSTQTPSRIPVSVSTPGKASSSSQSLLPPLVLGSPEARSDSRMNLLSPPTTSQLRQPSNLRNTVGGAASKIPRPGRKPYSKPTSRLPKPKTAAKASPVSSLASSKTSNPVTPTSPIKTRRGRSNQPTGSTITQSRSTVVLLPPDAIIYEPPAPRIRPKLQSPEDILDHDERRTAMEMDGDASSSRASPPIETGLSPPKSGLFLKSEARRLKEEVAVNPPGSVIPQFSATAPSLGIFPSLSRPKGKGRSTLLRPMMMPLDPTSLRNLTTSNTLRNQHYVCSKVETQVILKEGKRPASPTSKVKTILEKKKEEQEKSREERAARRVGKNAQPNGDQEMTDDNPSSHKHPRGAGDEEDYETPVKPERADMDLDDGKSAPKRKRVKWDKDLLQRFELEEGNLDGIRKAAEMAKARAATKGCLATQVLLDPLGNVPQADIPVANLVKEQVVVTKLVYIEDLPPSERPKRVAATKANARINIGAS